MQSINQCLGATANVIASSASEGQVVGSSSMDEQPTNTISTSSVVATSTSISTGGGGGGGPTTSTTTTTTRPLNPALSHRIRNSPTSPSSSTTTTTSSSTSSSATTPLLTPEAAQTLLYRVAREPLNPEVVNAVRTWMLHCNNINSSNSNTSNSNSNSNSNNSNNTVSLSSSTTTTIDGDNTNNTQQSSSSSSQTTSISSSNNNHNSVDIAYTSFLNALVAQAAAAKGPPGAMSRAIGFLGRLGGGSGNTEPVAEYPDVRLSNYLLHFGPEHAWGERIPPPGAAASRPPPPVAIFAAPRDSSSGSSANLVGGSARNSSPPPSSSQAQLVPCPAHTQLTCGVKLSNLGKTKAIVSIRPLQSFLKGDSCLVSVEPSTAVLDRGKSVTVNVTLRLLRPDVSADAFIVVESSGGNRLLALARAYCEPTVFGVRLEDVPSTSSAGYEGIPVPLASMRSRLLYGHLQSQARLQQQQQQQQQQSTTNHPSSSSSSTYLLSSSDPTATFPLLAEGIFRVAPSNEEKNAIRKALNDGSFSLTHPPYHLATPIAVAHMIKVFLRELPQPLFSAIPTETLLNAASEEDCISLIGWLTPPASMVFAWLVDLLVEVAKHQDVNKMGAKNLAICTGPNLFVTDESVNPMEALMTSQKAVNALYQVIQARAHGEADGRDIFQEHLGLSVIVRQEEQEREIAAARQSVVASGNHHDQQLQTQTQTQTQQTEAPPPPSIATTTTSTTCIHTRNDHEEPSSSSSSSSSGTMLLTREGSDEIPSSSSSSSTDTSRPARGSINAVHYQITSSTKAATTTTTTSQAEETTS